MRIVSDFHDYYDCIMRQGFDPAVTFIRKRDKVEVTRDFIPIFNQERTGRFSGSIEFDISTSLIGFCGKLHLVFEARVKTRDIREPRETRVFRSFTQAAEWVREYYDDKKVNKYFDRLNSRPLRDWRNNYVFNSAGVSQWNADHAKIGDAPFIEFGSPIFRFVRVEGWLPKSKLIIEVNPRLEDFGFQCVFPPYQAFQEIQQYLTGPLAVQKDPPQDIDDVTLARAKGFTDKNFRTDSPGKKKKRREK